MEVSQAQQSSQGCATDARVSLVPTAQGGIACHVSAFHFVIDNLKDTFVCLTV